MNKLISKIKSLFQRQETIDKLEREVDRLKGVVSYRDAEIGGGKAKNEALGRYVSDLEDERKDYEANILRRYLKKGCKDTLEDCEQLMGTDEALKHFGMMWGKYKVDTMMMITAIEHDYINEFNFTEDEINAVKHVIGKVGLFFSSCKSVHDTKVELQNLKAQEEEK